MARETGLSYVEGYAHSIIPVLHAWVTDGKNALDPTWDNGKKYYGVIFPFWYVTKILLKRKAYGVIDCWELDFPLLTGKDNYKQIMEVKK